MVSFTVTRFRARVLYNLIIMNSHLLALYFGDSILPSVVRIAFGRDLAGFLFHCNPKYFMYAYKTMM